MERKGFYSRSKGRGPSGRFLKSRFGLQTPQERSTAAAEKTEQEMLFGDPCGSRLRQDSQPAGPERTARDRLCFELNKGAVELQPGLAGGKGQKKTPGKAGGFCM